MVLNYIWVAFFIIGFIFALVQLIFFGDTQIFNKLVSSTFTSAKTGFEISLGLTGVLTLWMGLMRVGEKGGVVSGLTKIVGPLFRRLFPSLPRDNPAYGSMVLNIAANMLGLDNAATPMGLKAMKELQEVNPKKDVASDPMIMFLVLNASGLVVIPVSILVYRAQLGSANPADVFIPILISTFVAAMAGVLSVAIIQKINLLNKVVLAYFGGIAAVLGGIVWFFSTLPQDKITTYSTFAANFILILVITSFIVLALIRKVNVYDTFIEGAKEGFTVAVKIIPYLVAILVAIGIFRASGAMNLMVDGIASFFGWLGFDTQFADALPVAIMKPLSGSGSRGLMVDVMTNHGADSFVGRMACTMQGSTDTVFYVIAVYFGSVGIKNTRYAILCGLTADIVGSVTAILLSYLFYT
jgi:spore maturation protein SpmA/spore maturation protein SpmB